MDKDQLVMALIANLEQVKVEISDLRSLCELTPIEDKVFAILKSQINSALETLDTMENK